MPGVLERAHNRRPFEHAQIAGLTHGNGNRRDGGPLARALAETRDHPDFQFPQDENPQLARPGWTPALVDYLYLSLTNSVAFSPTDAMPLTHQAKLFMGIESTISLLTVLVVGARAINVLGS